MQRKALERLYLELATATGHGEAMNALRRFKHEASRLFSLDVLQRVDEIARGWFISRLKER